MPLTQYKLHRKALQDTIQLNGSSTVPQELLQPVPVSIPETNLKRQRVQSVEETIPTESSITISSRSKPDEEQPRQKKPKVKPVEAPVILAPPTPPVLKKPEQKAVVIQPVLAPEPAKSLPSNNGVLRELKSKTPAWKAEKPQNRGNPQGNSFTKPDDARSLIPDRGHLRFDSDSDGEDDAVVETTAPEPMLTEEKLPTPLINGNHSSIAVEHPPSPVLADPAEQPIEIKAKPKKTLDLLFEMKQCKEPGEKLGKKIQQQFGRQRAQHRKRAMDYNSLANFVDHAFGLDRQELEKQISSNECQTSASSPPQVPRDLDLRTADLLLVQVLPSSFSKLARLPLVAEAIETNDKIYDLYPPVNQCPSVETRIAFKLLELSEDFCPKLSEFREATVTEVDQATGEVTLQLEKPLQTVFHQPSKFYAPSEDEQEDHLTTVDRLSARLSTFSFLIAGYCSVLRSSFGSIGVRIEWP